MATPTIKKETITIQLEKGKGTILVSRPNKTNPNNTDGLIHQFTYAGNAGLELVEAIAAARRKLEEQIATAKPANGATTPAATTEPTADEPATEEPDEPADDEPATDEPDEPATDDQGDPDDQGEPPELEPIEEEEAADQFQTMLLF